MVPPSSRAGAATQTELPFTGLTGPYGVAVDTGGNVYITASQNNRVLKLADGRRGLAAST